MSYKSIAVLGDSITNGYWDQPFGGWVPRMIQKLSADHPYGIGVVNWGVDCDRICDAYHRFCSGVMSMEQADVLVAVGTTNDLMRWGAPDTQLDISSVMREEYWRRLLQRAVKAIPQVFVVGIAPVDEKRNPATGVNDWKFWCFNRDIEEYNAHIEKLAAEYKVPFFNPYPKCRAVDWNAMLYDGGHPNAAGHEFLAELAYEFLKGKLYST